MRYYLFLIPLLMFSCSEPNDNYGKDLEPVLIEDKVEEGKEPELEPESEPIFKEQDLIEDLASINYESDEYEDLDWLEYEASLTKDFSFVIIISTKSYEAALERAKEASEKLGYPLDLRGLHPNEEMGLSLPKDVCEAICGGDVVDYPQYLPRNDWGESKYVSVEYSNGFKGFTKGYYIVVVASGEKGDPIIQEAVSESRKFYKDAYAKTCGVWMGCGC